MEKTNDISAFPFQTDQTFEGYIGTQAGQKGMTLRDYFAGKALSGGMWSIDHENFELIAKQCYGMADEMLKERSK